MTVEYVTKPLAALLLVLFDGVIRIYNHIGEMDQCTFVCMS
jgi:hypothetical protein